MNSKSAHKNITKAYSDINESYYGRSTESASVRRKAYRSKRKPVEEAPNDYDPSYGTVHTDFEEERPPFGVKKVRAHFQKNPEKQQVDVAGWIFFNGKNGLEAFDTDTKNKFAVSGNSWVSADNPVEESGPRFTPETDDPHWVGEIRDLCLAASRQRSYPQARKLGHDILDILDEAGVGGT